MKSDRLAVTDERKLDLTMSADFINILYDLSNEISEFMYVLVESNNLILNCEQYFIQISITKKMGLLVIF